MMPQTKDQEKDLRECFKKPQQSDPEIDMAESHMDFLRRRYPLRFLRAGSRMKCTS